MKNKTKLNQNKNNMAETESFASDLDGVIQLGNKVITAERVVWYIVNWPCFCLYSGIPGYDFYFEASIDKGKTIRLDCGIHYDYMESSIYATTIIFKKEKTDEYSSILLPIEYNPPFTDSLVKVIPQLAFEIRKYLSENKNWERLLQRKE